MGDAAPVYVPEAGKVAIRDPDGSVWKVPQEKLAEEQSRGSRPATEAEYFGAKHGRPGEIAAFGAGAARGATFGLSDPALLEAADALGGNPEEYRNTLRLLKASSPNATLGGELWGTVAPAALTGGLGGAGAGASALARVGVGAAEGAAFGAASGMGTQLTEDTLENHKMVGEAYLSAGVKGGAIGLLLGGGGAGLGALFGRGGRVAEREITRVGPALVREAPAAERAVGRVAIDANAGLAGKAGTVEKPFVFGKPNRAVGIDDGAFANDLAPFRHAEEPFVFGTPARPVGLAESSLADDLAPIHSAKGVRAYRSYDSPHAQEPGAVIRSTGARVIGDVDGAASTLFRRSPKDAWAAIERSPKGYSMRLDRFVEDEGRVEVYGAIRTAKGDLAGEFGSTFSREDERLVARTDNLLMTEGHQGKGIGAAVARNMDETYARLGVDEVRLHASDVGRYTWAKAGYEWSPETGKEMAAAYERWLAKHGHGIAEADSALRGPRALAESTHGKSFLLSDAAPNWYGTRTIPRAERPVYAWPGIRPDAGLEKAGPRAKDVFSIASPEGIPRSVGLRTEGLEGLPSSRTKNIFSIESDMGSPRPIGFAEGIEGGIVSRPGLRIEAPPPVSPTDVPRTVLQRLEKFHGELAATKPRGPSPQDFLHGVSAIASGNPVAIGAVGLNVARRIYGSQVGAHALEAALRIDSFRRATVKLDEMIDAGAKAFASGSKGASRASKPVTTAEVRALREATRAPEAVTARVAEHLGDMPNVAPKVAQEIASTATRAAAWMQHALPREDVPIGPQFGKRRKTPLSDEKLLEARAIIETVADGSVVVDRLRDGSLTDMHVATLRFVHPETFLKIQSHLTRHATELNRELSMQQLFRLSILFGEPLTEAALPENVRAFQASFIQGNQAPGTGGGGGNVSMNSRPVVGGGSSATANDKLAGAR